MSPGPGPSPTPVAEEPTALEAARWEPESPFQDVAPAVFTRHEAGPSRPGQLSESPFLNELGDRYLPAHPATEAVAELLAGLHDPEFDVAVYELVHELSGLASARPAGEVGEARSYEASVERAIGDRVASLCRAYEDRLDELGERLAPFDAGAISEVELEALLDRATPPSTALGPTFEFFLDKLWEKTKKAVKGAVGFVKKGVRAVGRFALKPVLVGLRKLVRPLLRKVLTMAMDKIPARYRPLAEKIAARLAADKAAGGAPPADSPPLSGPTPAADAAAAAAPTDAAQPDAGGPAAAATAPAEAAAAPVAAVQEELDGRFAELLLAADELELEATLAAQEAEASRPPLDPVGELERSRHRFVHALSVLREGEDPRPAVEEFIPAILGALRIGIRLIGRKRVVTFLGGLLGKLIGPIVGKDVARPLATLVGDIGLKLLGFELSEADQREAAGRVVARTVEETVRRVAALPAYALDSEALLESHAIEAFEAAAAGSFPPGLIRQELREAPGVEAMWVPVPPRGRSYYKKFSRTFDVEITRGLAEGVHGFRGRTLVSFLRDVERASFPVRARVHLYEILPGGRLAHIAEQERARGLGQAAGHRLLHPLTVQAATALLRHPRLGTPFPPAPDPLEPRVGQRFYYLELEAAAGGGRVEGRAPGQASAMTARVDFPRDEIRVRFYLGEPAAQGLATAYRKSPRGAVLVHALRQLFAADADRLAGPDNEGVLGVIIDPPGPEWRASLASVAKEGQRDGVRRRLGASIVEWTWSRLSELADRRADELVRATEAPDEGVTLLLVFHHPPGMQALRRLLRGLPPAGDGDRWPPREAPAATVQIWAGHRPE